MNTKQIKIQKEIGEHIAALHSLREEFKRASEIPQDPSAQLQASLAKMTPKKRKEWDEKVAIMLDQIYKDADSKK